MTTRAEVVAQARTWIGTRWTHLGRIKGVGVDCAGVVIGVAHELNLSSFDICGYDKYVAGNYIERLCDQNMQRIDLRDIQIADVVLLKWRKESQHLGILGNHVSGELSLIHAWANMRKVVEHIIDDEWRHRFVKAYNLPGVV